MALLPLILAVVSLSVLTFAGIVLILVQFRKMNNRLMAMDRELRQFYRDLGRPKAEIINIKGRKRPS